MSSIRSCGVIFAGLLAKKQTSLTILLVQARHKRVEGESVEEGGGEGTKRNPQSWSPDSAVDKHLELGLLVVQKEWHRGKNDKGEQNPVRLRRRKARHNRAFREDELTIYILRKVLDTIIA